MREQAYKKERTGKKAHWKKHTKSTQKEAYRKEHTGSNTLEEAH